MYDFDYYKPANLADAAKAMQGEGAQALGGGQTLIPVMKQRLASPARLVDLSGLSEIVGFSQQDDQFIIGGATPHGLVAASAEVRAAIPALAVLASKIGDPQVRNKGTIGGSLANNDPAACYPAAALGCGATIMTNKREIAADDFFQGIFTTALDEGEIITVVKFPIPLAASYQKFEQPASRFSLTSVFVAKFADGVRVAVTGAGGDGVFRHAGLEAALSADFSPAAVDGVDVSADGLMSDLHASPEYRAHLVKVMAKRGVMAASA